MEGKVVWFCEKRGYGYIAPDDGGRDVFFHWRAIDMDGFKKVDADQRVSFNMGSNDSGPCAVDVEVIGE